MIDIIEQLSGDEEWMARFCEDCPERVCAAEGQPFHYGGCIKNAYIEEIERAAAEVERVAAEAIVVEAEECAI